MQDTYYVVAHFHYVLSLGAVFACSRGFYYWFPKMSGKMYNETLGKMHFFLMFVGVNIVFFPMHFLGLDGMPRRIPDYTPAFAQWNYVSTVGYMITIAGVAVFFVNLFWSLGCGQEGPANPWGEARRRSNGPCPARRRSTSSRPCRGSTSRLADRRGRLRARGPAALSHAGGRPACG